MSAVYQQMASRQRSAVWGFIFLLVAVAFLRSLAPERTERAVKHLLAVQKGTGSHSGSEAEAELKALKEELQRERAALERWKGELDAQRLEVESATVALQEEKPTKSADDIELNADEQDPDTYTDDPSLESSEENEQTASDGSPSDYSLNDELVSDDGKRAEMETDVSGKESQHEIGDLVDEPIPELNEDECPIIVAPESAKAGLGTQIDHIWSSLSMTLAVRNACIVIPPIAADNGKNNFRSVPFHEIFDAVALAQTGLRFVPLRTCQKYSVSTVFDDTGAETAIVKNFAAFVQESHPSLAKETTLVHGDSKGYRFQNEVDINGDVTEVAEYIRSKVPSKPGRHCIGLGRMRARIEINPDVLTYFQSATSIAEYITSTYPDVDQILFVKLRWNRVFCNIARTEDNTVCIFSDTIVPIEEYVYSIAYAAQEAAATKIYLSAPTHIPHNVSEFISAHLDTMDPVVLNSDGDFFTANILERELAVKAKRFVPDGGAWGQTVQSSRKKMNVGSFEEDFDSLRMIQRWRDAGWSKELSLIKGFDIVADADSETESLGDRHRDTGEAGPDQQTAEQRDSSVRSTQPNHSSSPVVQSEDRAQKRAGEEQAGADTAATQENSGGEDDGIYRMNREQSEASKNEEVSERLPNNNDSDNSGIEQPKEYISTEESREALVATEAPTDVATAQEYGHETAGL